jgi:hypothetical protein
MVTAVENGPYHKDWSNGAGFLYVELYRMPLKIVLITVRAAIGLKEQWLLYEFIRSRTGAPS